MKLIFKLAAGLPAPGSYTFRDLRIDVLSGITACGVVLPLTMGFGIISGLGAAAGLYGAVVVGIFGSLIGGTRGMIYGPNILIAVTMAIVVAEHADSLAEAASIAVLAGIMQIGFGLSGLGKYAAYVPAALISGFFTALGILLFVKQGLFALGSAPEQSHVLGNLTEWPDALASPNFDAVALTVICIVLSIVWRGPPARLVPAPFAVLGVGLAAAAIWFGNAPAIGEVPSGLPPIQLSAISPGFFLSALQPAFVMAMLASISSLVSSIKLDAITGSQHDPRREMFGQGVGNIAAGMVGGLAGSANSGTWVNVFSGGRTAVAGIACSLSVLAVLLFLDSFAAMIPLAVLAAIMLVIGWELIDWQFVLRIHKLPRSFAFVMVLTAILVLFTDLVTAVTVGLVVAVLAGARRLERLETAGVVSMPLLDATILGPDSNLGPDPFRARAGLVVFPDWVTIASARELSRILRPDIRGHQYSIFDLTRTTYVDESAAVIISELVSIAVDRNSKTIVIAGINAEVNETMRSMGLLGNMPTQHFAADVEAAKGIIRPLLLGETAQEPA